MSKVKSFKRPRGVAFVLFIISLLLLAFAVYQFIYSLIYLSSYAESYGVSIVGLGTSAFQYIVSAVAPYFAYAASLFGISLILNKVSENKAVESSNDFATPMEDTAEVFPDVQVPDELVSDVQDAEANFQDTQDTERIFPGAQDTEGEQ